MSQKSPTGVPETKSYAGTIAKIMLILMFVPMIIVSVIRNYPTTELVKAVEETWEGLVYEGAIAIRASPNVAGVLQKLSRMCGNPLCIRI